MVYIYVLINEHERFTYMYLLMYMKGLYIYVYINVYERFIYMSVCTCKVYIYVYISVHERSLYITNTLNTFEVFRNNDVQMLINFKQI